MDTDTPWFLFVALAISYPILLAVYRLFLHPLSKFPGPKITAMTGWYETYVDLVKGPNGNFMEEIERMHDEFGALYDVVNFPLF